MVVRSGSLETLFLTAVQPGVVDLPADAVVAAGLAYTAVYFVGMTDDRQTPSSVFGQLSFGHMVFLSKYVNDACQV
jgi:hypothetical protein